MVNTIMGFWTPHEVESFIAQLRSSTREVTLTHTPPTGLQAPTTLSGK